MIHRLGFLIPDNSLRRLLAYCVMLLFVFTADAVMSYWTPTFLQGQLSSSLLMGLVMSFSSLVGLGLDFVFPQVLRGVGTKALIALLLVTSLVFSGTMMAATWFPLLVLMLVGMAVWGVYYELLIFSDQQFVANTMPAHRRAVGWGVISVFKSLAYVLGPILAGWALDHSDRSVLFVAMGLSSIAILIFMFMRFKDQPDVQLSRHQINLWSELDHWRALIGKIWPLLLISITMGLVDATFWTTGTVWSEKLAQTHGLGGLFLSAYIFPSLFVGLVVAKLGIYEHKKKIATLFLLISNVVLIGIGLSQEILWQLLVVLISSILSGFAYPLVDAVYTDLVARMGRERKHLIGLSGSTFSLAYIVGPVLAGFVAQLVGEQQTFVVVGFGAALINLFILAVTPRKLKLPVGVKSWKD